MKAAFPATILARYEAMVFAGGALAMGLAVIFWFSTRARVSQIASAVQVRVKDAADELEKEHPERHPPKLADVETEVRTRWEEPVTAFPADDWSAAYLPCIRIETEASPLDQERRRRENTVWYAPGLEFADPVATLDQVTLQWKALPLKRESPDPEKPLRLQQFSYFVVERIVESGFPGPKPEWKTVSEKIPAMPPEREDQPREYTFQDNTADAATAYRYRVTAFLGPVPFGRPEVTQVTVPADGIRVVTPEIWQIRLLRIVKPPDGSPMQGQIELSKYVKKDKETYRRSFKVVAEPGYRIGAEPKPGGGWTTEFYGLNSKKERVLVDWDTGWTVDQLELAVRVPGVLRTHDHSAEPFKIVEKNIEYTTNRMTYFVPLPDGRKEKREVRTEPAVRDETCPVCDKKKKPE